MDNTIECDQCGAKFDDMDKLKTHKAQAHGVKSEADEVVCKMCGAKFATKEELDEHNKEVHPGMM